MRLNAQFQLQCDRAIPKNASLTCNSGQSLLSYTSVSATPSVLHQRQVWDVPATEKNAILLIAAKKMLARRAGDAQYTTERVTEQEIIGARTSSELLLRS